MFLHNRVNGKQLKKALKNSKEQRKTFSFYKYAHIEDPETFRNKLFREWSKLHVFGRIYVAKEGINAQLTIPVHKIDDFKELLDNTDYLDNIDLNAAVEDDGKSFFKLKILVRKKILADGLSDDEFDVTDPGLHVDAIEFNKLTDEPDTILVDMRNHYESEVGHFRGAELPDTDTFRETLEVVEEYLKGNEDKKIVMYCTGGIRCEKASAYYKSRGFKNVFQLKGGITSYAKQVKQIGLENKFIGKNFVFDERLGERITDEVISCCHQCGKPCDNHINCKNDGCHLLFIQCDKCAKKYNSCCSEECMKIIQLPEEQQKKLRQGKQRGQMIYKKGRSPKLIYK